MFRYIPIYDNEQQCWFVFDTLDKIILDYYTAKEYSMIIIMCDNLNQGWEFLKDNIDWFGY